MVVSLMVLLWLEGWSEMSFSGEQVSEMLAGRTPTVGGVLWQDEEKFVVDLVSFGSEVRFLIGRGMLAAVEQGLMSSDGVEEGRAVAVVWEGVLGHFHSLLERSDRYCYGGQKVFRFRVQKFMNDWWVGAGKLYSGLIGMCGR